MKKIILNEDRCIGCGACMSVAPDNFTFNDEGRAEMISDELTSEAIEASEMCPVNAITIEGNCQCNDECNCSTECDCNETCNCNDECNCGENCNCSENNKCSENCQCNK